MEVFVECSAHYRGDQEPQRLRFGAGDGRILAVTEILDRWYGADHRYFKLIADDGNGYILRHDEHAGRWELTLFQRGGMAQ